jgi:hypothetical protein
MVDNRLDGEFMTVESLPVIDRLLSISHCFRVRRSSSSLPARLPIFEPLPVETLSVPNDTHAYWQ